MPSTLSESTVQPTPRGADPDHAPTGHQSRSGGLAPAGRQVTNVAPILFGAGLGVLLVVLGLPTLVLVWRPALSSTVSPSGLVGGPLVLVGLTLLSVGGFSLVGRASRVEEDAAAGRWTAVLLRPCVLVLGLGIILLVCAAIAV